MVFYYALFVIHPGAACHLQRAGYSNKWIDGMCPWQLMTSHTAMGCSEVVLNGWGRREQSWDKRKKCREVRLGKVGVNQEGTRGRKQMGEKQKLKHERRDGGRGKEEGGTQKYTCIGSLRGWGKSWPKWREESPEKPWQRALTILITTPENMGVCFKEEMKTVQGNLQGVLWKAWSIKGVTLGFQLGS